MKLEGEFAAAAATNRPPPKLFLFIWTTPGGAADFEGMYYVGKNGKQSGPFTLEELRGMVGRDALHVDDLVWTEGMPSWKNAGTLPGLFGSAAVPPPPPGISPPGAQAVRQFPVPTFAEVPSYLWQSIVVTLLCCMPFGVVAIVHASKVQDRMAAGDVAGARQASQKAKKWCLAALICGLVSALVFFALAVAQGVSSGDLHFD